MISTWVALRSALRRVPFQPLDINCLYFLEYAGIPPQRDQHERSHADVRCATPEDVEGLARCQHTPEAFLKRFDAGDHCAVACVDGRIVGYEWFCDRSLYVEERYAYEIDVTPEAIYAYDAFILPEHRLTGIWLKFISCYLRDLMKRSGKQRIITMIDAGNHLSMKTHVRFGFRVVRKVLVVKMCGRTFSWKRLRGRSHSMWQHDWLRGEHI
jgi:GNAT superfamily N-acetyltransferase